MLLLCVGDKASPPSAPTSPSAVASASGITLSATPPAGTVTGYSIFRSTVSGSETLLVSGVSLPYLDTTVLQDGTTYYYTIAAQNGSVVGAHSIEVLNNNAVWNHVSTNWNSTAFLWNGPQLTVVAVGGYSQVSLTWLIVSGATSYNVQRSPHGASTYTTIATGNVPTSYTDYPNPPNQLQPGTSYDYQVRSVSPGGTSAWSAIATGTTFTPNSLVSAALYGWWRADYGCYQDGQCQFARLYTTYLSSADFAAVRGGRTMSFLADTMPYDKNNDYHFLAKGDGSTHSEYDLYYNKSLDRWVFDVYDGNNNKVGSVSADHFGSPTAANAVAAINFINAWIDLPNNQVGIDVNGQNNPNTSTLTGVPGSSSGTFYVGAGLGGTNSFNGRIMPVGIYNRLLTNAERTAFWSNGLIYPFQLGYYQLPSSMLSGLLAWWDGAEKALYNTPCTRYDRVALAQLTDNGNFSGSGIYVATVNGSYSQLNIYSGEVCWQMMDPYGHHFQQQVGINPNSGVIHKPLWMNDGSGPNGYPYLRGNFGLPTGTADYMDTTENPFASPLSQPFMIYLVVRERDTSTVHGIFDNSGADGFCRFRKGPTAASWDLINPNLDGSFAGADTGWHIIRLLMNGANSKASVDGGAFTSINPGAGALLDGLVIFANNGAVGNSDTDIAEMQLWSGSQSAGDMTANLAYLDSRAKTY